MNDTSNTAAPQELLERVQLVAEGVVHLREMNEQTPERGAIMLGKCAELIDAHPLTTVVIVDLSEATSKPSPEYREFMTRWAKQLPRIHAAYVMPPLGAVARMALRFVVGRMMNGHPSSTSSFHSTLDEALGEARRFQVAQKLNA